MLTFRIVGGLFTIIGSCFIIGFFMSMSSTKKFLAQSVVTEGEIINTVIRSNFDRDGYLRTSSYPLVRFRDVDGKNVEFVPSAFSRNIVIGEKVRVDYFPGSLDKAKIIETSFDIWGLTAITGLFGFIFTGTGIVLLWIGIRDNIREKRARTYSKIIIAEVKDIVQTRRMAAITSSPYIIEAEWLNPATNKVHTFKSRAISYDPARFLDDEVLVKADPGNLNNYWVDVSFLPKRDDIHLLPDRKQTEG